MKNGDLYLHFKGNEYIYINIGLPSEDYTGDKNELIPLYQAYDAHTPDGEELIKVQVYERNGILLIDKNEPHVIYQAKKDVNSHIYWVRKVDDFFGYKDDGVKPIKRFKKLKKESK